MYAVVIGTRDRGFVTMRATDHGDRRPSRPAPDRPAFASAGLDRSGIEDALFERPAIGRGDIDVDDPADRRRTLDYFERLGRDKVRLYTAVDCERFLGGWQVRELADQWLAEKDAEERKTAPLWRRLIDRGRRPRTTF